MQRHDEEYLKQAFARIRTRQLIGIAVALICVLLPVVIWKRPDLFGVFPKKDLMLFQLVMILAFVNFSAWNWKCPSCKKYLGNDIGTGRCPKCGKRLV